MVKQQIYENVYVYYDSCLPVGGLDGRRGGDGFLYLVELEALPRPLGNGGLPLLSLALLLLLS